jgi:hypothetical protein
MKFPCFVRPAQRLVGNVVSPCPVTSIIRKAALPVIFCAGASPPLPVSPRSFLGLLLCRRQSADFEFLYRIPEVLCARVIEKAAAGILGNRTCDPDEVLAEPQVVVPQVSDPGGRGSRAGLEEKVAAAMCVTARPRVCSVTAARKAHLGAEPLLTWSCHI